MTVFVASVAASLLPWGTAAAAPAPDIDTVRKQIDALQKQVAMAAETYNGAREQLATVTVRAKAAKTRVVQQQKQVEAGRRLLGQIAVEQYKSGDLNVLGTILSDDPRETMAVAGLAVNLSDRKAQVINSLIAAQQKLAQDQAALAGRQAELAEQTTRLKVNRQKIEAKLAERNRILAALTAAQRAALIRDSAHSDATELTHAGVPVGTRPDCGSVQISAPSERVARVIAFMCAQLGEPYQWGGSGPGSWDCSGLTQAAWAQAGVSLPHNARMQSGYGRHVPESQLQVGDLIYFFNYGHVGVYIGNGLMIHAPETGDVVKISSARIGRIIDVTRL